MRVVYAFFAFLCCLPYFFGRAPFLDDTLIISAPLKKEWARLIFQGIFPFWSDRIGGGFPVFAESQIGALFPLNLVFLLPFSCWVNYKLFLGLCQWLAGWGFYRLCRMKEITHLPAFCASVLYAFGGVSLRSTFHLPILGILGCAPWFILFLLKYVTEGKAGNLIKGAIFGSLIVFSGNPPIASAVFLQILLEILSKIGNPQWEKILLRAVQMLILVIGLSAVQWIPTAFLFFSSSRYAFPTGLTGKSVLWHDLFTFFYPLTGLRNPYEFSILSAYLTHPGAYLLLLGMLLSLAVPEFRYLAFCTLLGLFIATKEGYAFLLSPFPIFGHFREPVRMLFLFQFTSIFLIVKVLKRLKGSYGERKTKYFTIHFLPIALLSTLGAFLLFRSPLVVGISLLFYVLISFTAWRPNGFLFLFAFTFVDLTASRVVFWKMSSIDVRQLETQKPPLKAAGRIFSEMNFAVDPYKTLFKLTYQFHQPLLVTTLAPNTETLFGYSSALPRMSLIPVRLEKLRRYWSEYILSLSEPETFFPELAGVQYIITTRWLGSYPYVWHQSIFENFTVYAFENPSFIKSAKIYPLASILPMEREEEVEGFIFSHQALLEMKVITEGCNFPQYPQITNNPATFRILQSVPGRIDIEGESPDGGFLFVNTPYYPGWSAFLNGRRIPLCRAQYHYQGVFLPPGAFQVILRYVPEGFWIGLLITMASAVVLFICGLLLAHRDKEGMHPPA